jgi:hypothetical protein
MPKLQKKQNKRGNVSVSRTSINSGKLPSSEMIQQHNIV